MSEEADDEYGDLIEQSIKEFSMSLTQEQLESLNLNFTPQPDLAEEVEAKKLIKLPPIKQVPKFRTLDELAVFLNSEQMCNYRPQAKIVRVVESRSRDQIF